MRSSVMPSTVIRFFSYDEERRELEVTFVTGRRYLYFDVARQEADGFRAASSKGRHFNLHIRDRYSYRELAPADD
ncbi:MAG TPA: KTSC domain-containing protein [Sphingomicrobium sp.]|nr:KTSC domain-containing protein [Sphingomicrobium sp.]